MHAYVRSNQKDHDNIITEGFLMAENLNEYFSSVFTRKLLVHYQYQRLSSRGDYQTIQDN